ncbi:kinase-like domain-containing protein [Thelonectria olida]|uniref:Kinase-like domain-containing protein n=1 Tax=Thelonectria olida TaxID=1576542 RepID=A0A9P8W020_9HYPO|nr:kinase-like domain-containing protein [Thelonectria olida]
MDDDTLPDLVRDWELESSIDDNRCTVHVIYISDPAKGWWRRPQKERWEPKARLGRGSFGDVWLQECTSGPSAGKVRAVKEIETAFDKSSLEAKFLSREISAIVKFSHAQYRDCFVPSFGWYRTLGSLFITMEYLPLGDLQSYLHHPLPEAQAKTITQQVLQGVAFMHKSNFAHRDLKPKNILVQHKGPNWWVKLSDFGCSKQNESTALRTTVGTGPYLAPELQNIFVMSDLDLIASKTYSLAVDIWAVGAIAFRIATGRLPFDSSMDLYRYVMIGDPFPNDNSLSVECKEFIALTMSGSPRHRPTAVDALACSWIASTPVPEASTVEASALNVNSSDTMSNGLQEDTAGSASWSTIQPSSRSLIKDQAATAKYGSPEPIRIDSQGSEQGSTARPTTHQPTAVFQGQMTDRTQSQFSPNTKVHLRGNQYSSIHSAAENGDAEAVARFLECGADGEAYDSNFNRPIDLALVWRFR